jgi:hypothetical protein
VRVAYPVVVPTIGVVVCTITMVVILIVGVHDRLLMTSGLWHLASVKTCNCNIRLPARSRGPSRPVAPGELFGSASRHRGRANSLGKTT